MDKVIVILPLQTDLVKIMINDNKCTSCSESQIEQVLQISEAIWRKMALQVNLHTIIWCDVI